MNQWDVEDTVELYPLYGSQWGQLIFELWEVNGHITSLAKRENKRRGWHVGEKEARWD